MIEVESIVDLVIKTESIILGLVMLQPHCEYCVSKERVGNANIIVFPLALCP